jgi:outer membrane biosynthesis protein TonB
MARSPEKQTVRYPRKAERAGVGDSVNASFTIMSDGAVDLRSFDVYSGHYRDFIQAVITSLQKTRYEPARIGTCRVASRTTQLFVFKVPR